MLKVSQAPKPRWTLTRMTIRPPHPTSAITSHVLQHRHQQDPLLHGTIQQWHRHPF